MVFLKIRSTKTQRAITISQINNMLTELQIYRNREFLKDLRANTKKAKHTMREADGSRCCLCVALDTAERLGYVNINNESTTETPPCDMADFYGWPSYNVPLGPKNIGAAGHNDGSWEDENVPEKTHQEIADLFVEKFPELKDAVVAGSRP